MYFDISEAVFALSRVVVKGINPENRNNIHSSRFHILQWVCICISSVDVEKIKKTVVRNIILVERRFEYAVVKVSMIFQKRLVYYLMNEQF